MIIVAIICIIIGLAGIVYYRFERGDYRIYVLIGKKGIDRAKLKGLMTGKSHLARNRPKKPPGRTNRVSMKKVIETQT